MEVIPIARIKNREMVDEKFQPLNRKLYEILQEGKIYFLDLDGINHNKPNLCTYQKLSRRYELWVDSGPREMGDVVDLFMSGALSITLRKNLYYNIDMDKIRALTENKIYAKITLTSSNAYQDDPNFYQQVDGLVNFQAKKEIEENLKNWSYLKKYITKNNIYNYEYNPKAYAYWKEKKITGLIVDINKWEEFKRK